MRQVNRSVDTEKAYIAHSVGVSEDPWIAVAQRFDAIRDIAQQQGMVGKYLGSLTAKAVFSVIPSAAQQGHRTADFFARNIPNPDQLHRTMF